MMAGSCFAAAIAASRRAAWAAALGRCLRLSLRLSSRTTGSEEDAGLGDLASEAVKSGGG